MKNKNLCTCTMNEKVLKLMCKENKHVQLSSLIQWQMVDNGQCHYLAVHFNTFCHLQSIH